MPTKTSLDRLTSRQTWTALDRLRPTWTDLDILRLT
jgi:hypothetical protein